MSSLFHRISVRKYEDRPVESEKIEYMLRAAMQAPSAVNQQPWEFYVITERETLTALSKVTLFAKMCARAPVAIVACCRERCTVPPFAQIDMSIAMEHLWLACDEQGLGGVWLGIAPMTARMAAVEKIIGAPKGLKAFAIFPFGYPAESRPQQDRWDPRRIHYIGPDR